MGASALMSALNALPWEEDEGDRSSDDGLSDGEDDDYHPHDDRHSASVMHQGTSRPKSKSIPAPGWAEAHNAVSRMGSSLHTIRASDEQSEQVTFRRPKADEKAELAEEGKPTIIAEVLPSDSRRSSAASDGSLPPGTRVMLNDQIAKEQQQAGEEEDTEMARAGLETGGSGISGERGSAENTAAVLREHGDDDDNTVHQESGEKQRIRKEKLGQKLMEVFGLPEREEVLEEMRCWLLRSISEFDFLI